MTDRASSMHASLENSLVFDIPVQEPSLNDYAASLVLLNDYYVFAFSTLLVNVNLTIVGYNSILED